MYHMDTRGEGIAIHVERSAMIGAINDFMANSVHTRKHFCWTNEIILTLFISPTVTIFPGIE